jgi:hypothetical protein
MQDSDYVLVVKLSHGHQFTIFKGFVLKYFLYADYLLCLHNSDHVDVCERTPCDFYFIFVDPMQLSQMLLKTLTPASFGAGLL